MSQCAMVRLRLRKIFLKYRNLTISGPVDSGSFASATCIRCKNKVDAEAIKDKVLRGEVPFCSNCSTPDEISRISFPIPSPSSEPTRRSLFEDEDEEGFNTMPCGTLTLPPVLKPDIVFFGEDLPDEFHDNLENDKPDCDLLLVIGSSLRVRPVSSIPGEYST